MTVTGHSEVGGGVALDLPVGEWLPITTVYAAFHGPYPMFVRFPTGEVREAGTWRSVFGHVASWLSLEGKVTEPMLLPSSEHKNFVSDTQSHANGEPFHQPFELPNGLWLEVGGSEPLQRDRAILLLKELDIDPSSVQVRLDHPNGNRWS